MKRIGITGGIGSGKTTVSQYLIDKGFTVFDADHVARDLVKKNSPTLQELSRVFGSDILTEEGELDRKKLASIIFKDNKQKERLDQLMHDRILEDILSSIEKIKGEMFVFIDAPLLLEAGWDRYLDEVWVVDSVDEKRIERIMARDHMTKPEVLLRMKAQFSREERLLKADKVLDNNADKESVYKQVNKLLNELEAK